LLFGATFARQSTRIIAISDFTRSDLIQRWGLDNDRVTTVLEGVPEQVPADPARQLRTWQELGLNRPFIFYPAADHAHKNHLGLVRALARLNELHGSELDLVLTGARGPVWARAEAEAERLGIDQHVRHLGFVERGQLFDLFHLASVMAFPSEFEGFGLPLLEAQRCSLPVVASTAASIPEVSGGAALLVDAHDIDGWAEALHRAHADSALRADLVRRGHANLKRFSWRRCARETLEVFEKALRR
jgi:glycosyltransferase involved in cell wall biosynthesis